MSLIYRDLLRVRIVQSTVIVLLLISLISVVTPASPAQAATYTVTKTADTNDGNCNADCSLREAVAAANASAGADTINLSVTGTYTLGSELSISSEITIQESGGVTATLSGGGTTRLFVVSTASGALTLNGLTVQNGNATTAGGCIQLGAGSGGSLTFTNGTLQNCSTTNSGGAIGSTGATHSITISGSTLQNNTAGINGGAISQSGTASNLSISNTTFTTNRAGAASSAQGGAIVYAGQTGSFNITNSTFNNNRAQSTSTTARGGAIAFTASVVGMNGTISDSTFTNNQAVNGTTENSGGAIYKTGVGGLTTSGSVLTGNSATHGGAIYSNQGTQSVTSSRIQNNTASNNGGAYYTVSGVTDSITGSCIVNNSNTAVFDAEAAVGQNTTATGNWWGSSWGPQITGAGGNSALSVGDSISGNGTTNINVGLTNASSNPPTGNWITIIPTIAGAPCTNLDPSYVVTKTADTNDGVCNADCSLREAITAANANPGSDMITFASGANGTITLGSALPNITGTGTLTIAGNGATNTIIRGNNAFQIFRTTTNGVNLSLSSLRLTNGQGGTYGGAIEFDNSNGVLNITNATLSNNRANTFGGAISFSGASLTANNVTFQSNSAAYGGAIEWDSGTVNINDSTFTGNNATTLGAAIHRSDVDVETININDSVFTGNTTSATIRTSDTIVNIDGSSFTNNTNASTVYAGVLEFSGDTVTATLRNSIVENNTSAGGSTIEFSVDTTGIIDNMIIRGNSSADQGGGVYVAVDASVTITDSLITGNSSSDQGGGVYVSVDGRATITDSLITDNSSAENGGGLYAAVDSIVTITNSLFEGNSAVDQGGGLVVVSGAAVTLNNVTISDNTAPNGGGIRSSGNITLNNSIVANSVTGVDCLRSGGTINALTSLIESGLTCVNGTNTNNQTGDPALNGSFQLTSSSPAINAGNNSLIPVGVTTDLAGNARIQQTTVDMGAYESAFTPPLPVVTISPATFNVNEGSNANFTITRTGSTTSSLAVTVNITRGVDTVAADYTLSGGSITGQSGSRTVTIPVGSASVNVNMAATNDVDAEADNTLTMALVDAAAYNLGTTSSSMATIPANDTVVTNTLDAGDGSLRQAIINANAFSSDDTITFTTAANGTITLASKLPDLTNNGSLTITGNGTASTIINGNGAYRGLFYASDAATIVTVQNLQVTNANPGTGASGGVISFNSDGGFLTLNSVLFQGNTAHSGGTLFAQRGTVAINNSTLQNNTANTGGGLVASYQAIVTVTNTLVTGNSATYGSGVYNVDTILNIHNSRFVGNTGSTDGSGAGIFHNFGTTRIVNSLVANNTGGGGVRSISGTLDIMNSTIVGNTTTDYGAGFTNNAATLRIYNSIVADNTGGSGDCVVLSGTSDIQHTLMKDGTCITNGVSGNVAANPAMNVDYTLTNVSPAVNAGNNNLIPVGVTTDLAGNTRIQQTTVDMGAYESPYTRTTLTVQLTLQGRPAAPNAAYMVSGEVEVRSTGGAVVIDTTFTADNMGRFTIANVPTGTVDIWIKGSHTLARLHEDAVISVGGTFTTSLLLEGDANNDNSVILVDFSLLAASFGTQVGNPGYDARADFNMDGLINLTDFSLLASNFGAVGG